MKTNIPDQISLTYGNRIRIRACGILCKDQKILLLNHQGIGQRGFFWNVPGGEPERGESIHSCLRREFFEETHLKIKVGKLIYVNEYINKPLHAIEFYFATELLTGIAKLGKDPEGVPILSALKWFDSKAFTKIPDECKPSFLAETIK